MPPVKHLLAAAVALAVLAAALTPHVDAGRPHAEERCAACVVRAADAVGTEAVDLEPVDLEAGEAALAPGLPPVTGAPLGAIPGQSPPA